MGGHGRALPLLLLLHPPELVLLLQPPLLEPLPLLLLLQPPELVLLLQPPELVLLLHPPLLEPLPPLEPPLPELLLLPMGPPSGPTYSMARPPQARARVQTKERKREVRRREEVTNLTMSESRARRKDPELRACRSRPGVSG